MIDQPTQKKNPYKKWLWLVGVLTFVGLVLMIGQRLVSPIFEKLLSDNIRSATNGLYELQYKKLNVKIVEGGLVAWDVALVPNLEVHRQMTLKGDTTSRLYEVFAPRLKISGVDLYNAFVSGKFDIGGIQIQEPSIHMTFFHDLKTQQKDSSELLHDQADVHSIISDFAVSIKVKDVSLRDGCFHYHEPNEPIGIPVIIGKVNVELENIGLNAIGASGHQTIFAEEIEIEIEDYQQWLTDSSYTLNVASFRASYADEFIHAQGVEVWPMTSELNVFKSDDAGVRFAVRGNTLKVEGVSFNDFLEYKKIKVKALMVDGLEMGIHNRPTKPMSKDDLPDSPEDLLKAFRYYLYADTIGLRNADVSYHVYNQRGKKQDVFEFPSVSGNLYQLTNDSLLLAKPDFVSNAFDLKVQNFERKLDAFYSLEARELGLSSQRKHLYFKDVKIKPSYAKYEFGKAKGEQTDRLDIAMDRMILSSIDFPKLLKEHKLRAGKLQVSDYEIGVFRDKRLPLHKKPKPHFQDIILNFGWNFKIDEIELRKGDIVYEEHSDRTDKRGKFYISQANASLKNLTNDSYWLRKNKVATLDIDLKLMDAGLLTAQVKMPMTARDKRFTMEGTVGKMKMKHFNNIILSAAEISIRNGQIDQMDFKIKADDKVARGEMNFLYRDLKISLESRNEKGRRGLKERLGSLVANTLIIKNDNPSKRDAKPRIGRIYYKRDPARSIFSYWTKSLLQGVRTSIGLKDKDWQKTP